jgi:hypothetical protein
MIIPSRWERTLAGALKGSSLAEDSPRERIERLVASADSEGAYQESKALRELILGRKVLPFRKRT